MNLLRFDCVGPSISFLEFLFYFTFFWNTKKKVLWIFRTAPKPTLGKLGKLENWIWAEWNVCVCAFFSLLLFVKVSHTTWLLPSTVTTTNHLKWFARSLRPFIRMRYWCWLCASTQRACGHYVVYIVAHFGIHKYDAQTLTLSWWQAGRQAAATSVGPFRRRPNEYDVKRNGSTHVSSKRPCTAYTLCVIFAVKMKYG